MIVDQRIIFHEDCERLDFEVAKELHLLKEQKERDPLKLALEKKAQKHVDKRKAEAAAEKAVKQQKSGQPKPYGRGQQQGGPAYYFPVAQQFAWAQFGGGYGGSYGGGRHMGSYGCGRGGGRFAGRGGGGPFSGPLLCWQCEQPGLKSDVCPNAGGASANAGRHTF
jgi:hypothetical protein